GGHDTAIGGAAADWIFGATGDDVLVGDHARVDYFQAGYVRRVESIFPGIGGDDSILGEAGDDVIIAGDGADVAEGGLDNDIVHGDHAWVEHMGGDFAGTGTLWHGFGGRDELFGSAGNDILFGGTGGDDLAGEGGDDLLVGDYGQFTYDAMSGHQFTSTGRLVPGEHQDNLVGDIGDDVLIGGQDSDALAGDDGDDILIGDRGRWEFFGGSAAWSWTSYAREASTMDPHIGAADVIVGDAGSDMAFGGAGVDHVHGDLGRDFLLGDFGAAKRDALGAVVFVRTDESGEGADDFIEGHEGVDFLFGGHGADLLEGHTGDDVLVGDYGELLGDPMGLASLSTSGMGAGEV
ncbi:MAG: calcium-binding protein, partial [Actinomycetota bacterium]|nr:calcium-binding protein [Actinomycetota bacterium]